MPEKYGISGTKRQNRHDQGPSLMNGEEKLYILLKKEMRKPIPFHLSLLRGSIGKKYVVKHYCKNIVITKFPDMTGIIATKGQKECRKVFKDAVAYAKAIIYNAEKKKMLQERLGNNRHLFNAAIKEYMKKVKPEKTNPCNTINERDIKIYQPSKRYSTVPDLKRYPGVLFHYSTPSGKITGSHIFLLKRNYTKLRARLSTRGE